MKVNFTYRKLQWFLVLFMFFGFSNYVIGATYYARASTAWKLNTTWSTVGAGGTAVGAGVFPGVNDDVIISGAYAVSVPASVSASPYAVLCKSLTINSGGSLTFVSGTNNVSSLTCTNDIICGNSNTKGTLATANSINISCRKLFLGTASSPNVSIINRGTNNANSATFEFTGSGTDVLPELTGDGGTVPDFNTVRFNPGEGNTVTIPPGFSAKVVSINAGILDIDDNWNAAYTSTSSTNISILGSSTIKVGGEAQLPTNYYYIFGTSSTVDFAGTTQIIKAATGADFKNLTLSGPGTKTLDGAINVELTLNIQDNVVLDASAADLKIMGSYANAGNGCIRGNNLTNIYFESYTNASMQFDQSNPGVSNVINHLTLGLIGDDVAPSELNPLDLTIQNSLNIFGTVSFNAGHLVSNGNVTFKSNTTTTAFVGPIADTSICGVVGNVTVERYIPAGSNNGVGTNLGRAYRGLSSSVTGGTIFSNWQENGSVATLTGSILGNTLTTTLDLDLLNKHISGVNIPANTTITDATNASSGEYVISTSQTVATRGMIAYTSISTATIKARFTGSITNNELDVTAFTAGSGQLAVGQKITGGTFTNTVITGLGSGTGGVGTYTIGLEIPSETMHYNGAPAGFGTHVTGLSCTDAQLGQNDSATGLDYTRSGNPSLYTYSNGSQVFGQVMSTKATNLVAGTPYLIAIRGDRTIDLALNNTPPTNTTLRSTGEIVAGPVDVTTSLNTTASSFNFVGNPYQAPVDLSLIYEGGAGTRWVDLGTSYTVFDSKINTRGAYVTFDFTEGSTNVTSAMNATLEPNQAFFVTTTGATPTLVFNETDKNTADNTYVQMFRSTQNTTPKIKGSICNATTNNTLDGFIIAFSDNYNNSIIAEDTRKPSGNQDETFASTNDVTKMAIDKRSFPSEADEIPLSITQYRLTNYVMKFNVSNFDQMDAYLVDTYTATETTLNNNEINSYPFTVDTSIPASIAENRFKIVFRNSALQTNSNSISAFAVYPNPVVDNKFTIKSNQAFSGKDANVNIINSLGQKVFSFNGAFSTDGSLLVNPTVALSISKGIYLVKVAVEGKVETKKLIIK